MSAALRLYRPRDQAPAPTDTPPRRVLDVLEMHEVYLVAPADIARELKLSPVAVAGILTRYYESNRRIILPSRINLMEP